MCRRRRRRSASLIRCAGSVIAYLEETGTLAAVNSVDLVARIPGFVHGDPVQGRRDREEGHAAVP